MKVVVIIPTYNEHDNIRALIPDIEKHIKGLAHDVHILVADDASPDNTAAAVMSLQEQYVNLHLMSGKKEGIGRAYVRGMHHALVMMRADVVVEMDADFSHDPADVPRLIESLVDCDVVLGSRYIPGGAIPATWSLFRRLNSQWGNIFARYVAGMIEIMDCTTGFRAMRAEVLSQIDVSALTVSGYVFQVDILWRAIRGGFRIKEVPIVFSDRAAAVSKLRIYDVFEFIVRCCTIRICG